MRRISLILRLVSLPLLALPALAGCAGPPERAGVWAAHQAALPEGAVASIRFVMRRDLPLARTRVNGQDVGFFLIDTGAATTVIEQSVAGKLNLPQAGEMLVTGIGGTRRVSRSRIDSLQVDGLIVGPCRAATVDLSEFNQRVGWPVAGILGLDHLRSRPFTIDFAAGVLTIHEASGPGLPVERGFALTTLEGLPAALVQLSDRDTAWMQLDTGSNGAAALPYAYVRDRPHLLAGKRNLHTQAFGVAGMGRGINSELDAITVFGRQVRNVPLQVELPDPRTGGDAPTVGRLGNGVLKGFRLTLDLQRQRAWVR